MTAQSAALLALESRTRASINQTLATAQQAVTAQLAVTITEQHPLTGGEVISDPEFHAELVAALAAAQSDSEQTTRAAYTAAALIALLALRNDMRDVGHTVTDALPTLGGALAALIASIGAAYASLLPRLRGHVQTSYDTHRSDPARLLVQTNTAVKTAFGPLRTSVRSAAVVAVHRAPTDTQQAVYDQFARTNPFVALRKRWDVTSATPCPTCAALDGTTVAAGAQFDHGDEHAPAVWRDLYGPPRHPNCRCRITHLL